jgi:hypothetical protein
MTVRVKICGCRSVEQALAANSDFRWGLAGKRFWVLPIFHYRSLPKKAFGEYIFSHIGKNF